MILCGRPAAGLQSNARPSIGSCIQPALFRTPPVTKRAVTTTVTAATEAELSDAASDSNAAQTAAPPAAQQQQSPRYRSGTGSVRRPRPKPFLIRIAGRTSDSKAASGAIVKRLRTEDMVRVAAIDADSLLKAMIVLTAANNMVQANSGHMLVFQPVYIGNSKAAEPPSIPEGSMVMYTSQIMQGEVMTFNTLRVRSTTDYKALSKAIISRIATNSHTVLECYGTAALTTAVRAVAQARKGLVIKAQDIACIITSTRKESDTSSDSSPQGAAAAAAANDSRPEPAADAQSPTAEEGSSSSSGSSGRAPTCHRLVVLECEPRRPRALLVTSSVGVTDRLRQPVPAADDVR